MPANFCEDISDSFCFTCEILRTDGQKEVSHRGASLLKTPAFTTSKIYFLCIIYIIYIH